MGSRVSCCNRGYAIGDLASRSDFMEVCHLLLHGHLPDAEEKRQFEHDITYHSMLHEQLMYFYRGFRRDAHPMAIMVGVVGALSSFYHEGTDISDPEQRRIAAYRLVAKMPTIAAHAFKYAIGQAFIYPRNDLSYAENFLHMTYAVPCESYVVSPVLARAMDRILILHARPRAERIDLDRAHRRLEWCEPLCLHSSGHCVPLGARPRWRERSRPQHAPGNRVQGPYSGVLKRAKDRDDPFRLMGFGHRVYKNHDPRATVMRESCH